MNPLVWAIITVILLIIFIDQVKYAVDIIKERLTCLIYGEEAPVEQKESLTVDPKANSISTYEPSTADSLKALGYTGGLPWDEVIQATELDPSTFINHEEFVKDVRRFSSGANFTSVADDNTNLAFTNFIGLRRPEAPLNMIGGDARQIPDIDETVLARTKAFRWNSTS